MSNPAVLIRTPLTALLAATLMALPLSPAFAQAAPSAETVQEEPLEADEEPELPEAQLQLPEDDPTFEPNPDELPLEEDFLRMPLVEDPIFWRVELREQLGWTSNVDQIATGNASGISRTALSGLFRYTFPTNTQVLLRSQAFLFNNFNVPDRDQFIAVPLSVTASQWFNNQFNVYAGYLPIFSSSIFRSDNSSVQRFDNDVLLGTAYYQPVGENNYLFGGYQFDFFAAGLPSFSHLGNLFFAGYRHSFRDDLFLFADARIQPRGYTATPELLDEIRVGGGLALQWHVFRPWLILEARGDYNQFVNWTQPERSAGIFSLGINLISAIQSDS
ncbi:MAG: hypothetical protein ACO1RX_13810 [Candidatus Sericytochromatia bacterium]